MQTELNCTELKYQIRGGKWFVECHFVGVLSPQGALEIPFLVQWGQGPFESLLGVGFQYVGRSANGFAGCFGKTGGW